MASAIPWPVGDSAFTSPGIVLSNARLAFDGKLLFEGLGAELPAGSWSCLLGRSGCGKSTLLRLMAGLPVGGEAQIDLQTSDGQTLAGRMAWMAQQDLLLPWQRVIDNITLGDTLRGQRPNRERALALLEAVGLADTAYRRPDALSGGQRSRVALVRTLYEGAGVVLMDEPFAALDAITRLELHDLAARLLADRTVIMVTHDPAEALRLADRLLVMSGSPLVMDTFDAPAGTAPRDIDDPQLVLAQRQLLRRLLGQPDSDALTAGERP